MRSGSNHGVIWAFSALCVGGCAASHGMELANRPAYGRPSTCPESPAQFVQPGGTTLDPFSPDAARCSYVPSAGAAPARLRGAIQRPGPNAAPTLGPGVEGVRVELYSEGTKANGLEGATPIGRARTDASGAYFLTAPIEEAGEFLLVVHGEDGQVPLASRIVRVTPGEQTMPTVVLTEE